MGRGRFLVVGTASGETLRSDFPDQTMVVLRCRFSLGSIVCGTALDDRGRRWSGFVWPEDLVELSSHAWPTGATLSHAWLVGATHDGSSRIFVFGRMSAGRWRCLASWWSRSSCTKLSVEMSSHVWSTGATLCHAWSAGATHDRSSRIFTSRSTSRGGVDGWTDWQG